MKRAAFLAPLLLAGSCATLSNKPTDPELVELTAKLSQDVVLAAQPNALNAVLKIRGKTPANTDRVPLHIALVIDASGSMKGEAIARAREAAVDLMKRLGQDDRFTVVAFNTQIEVLAEGDTIANTDLDKLTERLEGLQAIGTTNLVGGMGAALAVLESSPRTNEVRRVVLLSDGRPNNPAAVESQIQSLAGRQIPVTALGLGLDFDELLLARIAEASGGRYTFVEEPKMIAEVFEREVMRLDRVIAKNVLVAITPGPGIRVLRVEGQPAGERHGAFTVALGDLSAEETREVVLSIATDSRKKDVTLEMLDVVVSFEDAIASAGTLKRREFLAATTTMDEAKAEASRDVTVLGAAARARAGSAALDAIALARSGQKEQAELVIDNAIAQAKEDAKVFEDPRLAEALENLVRLREDLPSAAAQAHLEEQSVSAKNRRAHSSAWSYTH